MKDLIKEVAPLIANEIDFTKADRFKVALVDLIITRGLAELSKRAEAVAYLRFWAGQYYSGHGNIETDEGLEVTSTMQQGDDGSNAFPVFTFPPIHDIEAIENRVAEACAKAVENEYQYSIHHTDILAAKNCATAIRSGEWRKYK